MANLDQDAIFKAYPDVVSINDKTGAFDKDDKPVTLEQSKIDAARVELDKLNYQIHRVGTATTSGYIPIQDQLDQLYHDINAGKFGADAKTGDWFVGISSVKAAFPKPS